MAKDPEPTNSEKSPPAKKVSKSEILFWIFLALLAGPMAYKKFVGKIPSPWEDICGGAAIVCLVGAIVLLFKAYPHPLRTLNTKLAKERKDLSRQQKRKKGKKF